MYYDYEAQLAKNVDSPGNVYLSLALKKDYTGLHRVDKLFLVLE